MRKNLDRLIISGENNNKLRKMMTSLNNSSLSNIVSQVLHISMERFINSTFS